MINFYLIFFNILKTQISPLLLISRQNNPELNKKLKSTAKKFLVGLKQKGDNKTSQSHNMHSYYIMAVLYSMTRQKGLKTR